MRFRWPFVMLAILLAGCSDDGGSPSPSTTTTTAAAPRPTSTRPQRLAVRLEEVAHFERPVALVHAGDEVFVAEQHAGRVRALGSGETVLRFDVSTGNEQGLLGLAVAPDDRHWYVNYTDPEGHTHVVEYAARDGRPDPDSARELLFVEQPYANHNGGGLAFGPDGELYTGLGDGGSGGDPHGNAQSDDTLLGKMVRVTPEPQIWVKGVRNPWRFSFDRETGDLWIGDVGQSGVEEIDHLPAGEQRGANLGWDRMEGSRRHEGDPPAGHVLPVHEFPLEGDACAVTGGYVYRGDDIPALRGLYVFADFCVGDVMALDPATGDVRGLGVSVPQLSSFAEDPGGELYVISLGGTIHRMRPA